MLKAAKFNKNEYLEKNIKNDRKKEIKREWDNVAGYLKKNINCYVTVRRSRIISSSGKRL